MAKSTNKLKTKSKKIPARLNSRSGGYLDYASSVSPNPSSIHGKGMEAKKKLENARKSVASVLGARLSEIIFTSGGTESNNLAIQGATFAALGESFFQDFLLRNVNRSKNLRPLPHIITTNIEHPSVIETCRMLEKRKLVNVSIVPVEPNGIVDPKKIKKELKKNTVLVSVMYANNEIGTIQPIKEIAKEIRHYRKEKKSPMPFFHTDAVQAANYLDLNVERLGVDLLTLSGSKIEGAGRVGMLYKKRNTPMAKISGGGDQESGLRPGTENLSEIIEFSQALEFTQKIKDKESKRLVKLRDYFLAKLLSIFSSEEFGLAVRSEKKQKVAELIVNGDLNNRLPNNVNITIPNIPSDLLVIELSEKGIMASAKSACKSGDGKVSHVIYAINKNIKDTDGSLRFSFGRGTAEEDIDYTVKSLSQILTKLRKWYY